MSDAAVVLAFTDGACLGNPGPGGYAALLRMGTREREITGGEPSTTNNRMELMAAIAALEALKRPVRVTLTSDSQYVLKGMKEWLKGWKARGWRTKDKKDVANRDLWERLDKAAAPHEVDWLWVKGHAGHVENERVDQLANAAAERYRHGAGHDSTAAWLGTAARPEPAPGLGSSEAGSSGSGPGESGASEAGRAPTAHAGDRAAASQANPGLTEAPGATTPAFATRVLGQLHVGCALAGTVDAAASAPSWCRFGVGSTGVHCLTGSGESVCRHAVPSLALERLEVTDARGQSAAFDLTAGRSGSEVERARSLLEALGAAAATADSPKKAKRKKRPAR